MCGVIVVDVGNSRSTNLVRDAYIMIIAWISSIWSSINCPTVIVFPPFAFFSREPTSETYSPRVSFHHIFFAIYFPFHLFSDLLNEKYKNTLLQFICSAIYLSYLPLFTSRYLPTRGAVPEGIHNPFNTSGCEYLLFVWRWCLHGVRRFSNWFGNLDLITERNTYRRYIASSLSLWGNTNVVLADIMAQYVPWHGTLHQPMLYMLQS